MAEENTLTGFVEGDSLELDESRTPLEFADEELLTIEQAAKYLGCPASKIREWLSSGQLTAIPAGSIERIARSELQRIGDPDETGAREFEKEHS